jgi:hypothetical protein
MVVVVAVAVMAPSSGGNILANSGSVCQFSVPGWSSITNRGGHGVASGRMLVHLECLIVPVVLANDQNGARTVGDISATDREVIVRQAAVAGDQEGAQVARETAQRDGRASNGQEPLGSILRKASKIILTYGRPSLSNPVCAWADKIYGLVDSIGATTELDTAAFLTQNGNPADVAIEITWWFVTFA